MKNVITKLQKIQSSLKAPKGQTNNFGGYSYRSCEDILTALKPLLRDNTCVVTITDAIEVNKDRVYIVATAQLWDCESGEHIETHGNAREAETKKGMDDAQITGSASSYARKYALNGLFAIDDTKDADATNDHGKGASKPTPSVKPDLDTLF